MDFIKFLNVQLSKDTPKEINRLHRLEEKFSRYTYMIKELYAENILKKKTLQLNNMKTTPKKTGKRFAQKPHKTSYMSSK